MNQNKGYLQKLLKHPDTNKGSDCIGLIDS